MKNFFVACLLFVSATVLSQTQAKKIVADKIAVIVGDRIILQSEIKNSIADIARQGGTIPDNAECMLMDQAIISKVLMLQAEKDSLPVSDEEVEAELDQKIRYYVNQLGSVQALEDMAGKTVYQIKDDAKESVKEQKLAAAMQQKIVGGVRITPNEVKTFFERIPKDSLPFYESELEIGQIMIYPKASRDLEQYIIGEMQNYKKQIESKLTTFDQLAKKVSEDPGSKDRGGQYEINRNEKSWDPIFMSTAFRLKEGEISAPVKSKFGFHIIQMVQRNGDDAVVRHILRIPPVTDDEIKQAISKLDTVRSKIIAGTINFNEALDQTLLLNTFSFYHGKDKVACKFQITDQEKKLQFFPDKMWKKGEYTVKIEGRLEDLAGNNLNRLFEEDLTKSKQKKKNELFQRAFEIQ